MKQNQRYKCGPWLYDGSEVDPSAHGHYGPTTRGSLGGSQCFVCLNRHYSLL